MTNYEMKSFRATKSNVVTVTLNNGSKYKVDNAMTISNLRKVMIEKMTAKAIEVDFKGDFRFSIPKKFNAELNEHFTAVKLATKKATTKKATTKKATTKKSTGRCKKVVCVETGKVYNSIGAAAAAIGVTPPAVSTVVRGVYDHVKGFHFNFVEAK